MVHIYLVWLLIKKPGIRDKINLDHIHECDDFEPFTTLIFVKSFSLFVVAMSLYVHHITLPLRSFHYEYLINNWSPSLDLLCCWFLSCEVKV